MRSHSLMPRYPVPALNVALTNGGRFVLGANPGTQFDLLDLQHHRESVVAGLPYGVRKVVELVAEKGEWGRQVPKGHGLGIAVHRSFVSYIATIVEVAVDERLGKASGPDIVSDGPSDPAKVDVNPEHADDKTTA